MDGCNRLDSNVQYAEKDEEGNVVEVINGVYRRFSLDGVEQQSVDCVIEDVDEEDGNDEVDIPPVEVDVDPGEDDDIVVLEGEGADGEVVLQVLPNVEGCNEKGEAECPPPPVLKPFEGMRFSSGGEFVAHMNRYGYSAGFGVTIREAAKDKRLKSATELMEVEMDTRYKVFDLEKKYKHHIKIRMRCRKAGDFKSRSADPNRSTTTCKTKCPYVVNACRSPINGTSWKITKVHEFHNHPLDPELSRHLPKYRRISLVDQMTALKLHKSSIGVAKIYDMFVNEYRSFEEVPFTEQDLRNFIYFSQGKPMTDTDFLKMQCHFKRMTERCPGFFYEVETDGKGKVKSVFWADARCIEAVKEFGDVVTFDTTFLTNRYRMPLAAFIGVNHHGKTILLGCALLSNEEACSFSWLFRVWKKCMGKQPACLLIDQDPTIGVAVRKEFPGISHRWRIWHVKRNGRNHLGMLPEWREIANKLQEVLHDSFSVKEFEAEWKAWAEQYDVGRNDWVKRMWKFRTKWAPVYFKSTFWAGMSSTQRSEGMNHYLKGFVNVNTCLAKFVEEYGKAVCKRVAEEGKDTKICQDRSSRKTSNHPFEDVFEALYTREKFEEVQAEMCQLNSISASIVKKHDENVVEYDVLVKKFRVGWTKQKNFRVIMDRSNLDVKCECQLFEFSGIMCSHMLRVFWEEDIGDVPSKYVCRRWRKDIPRKYLTQSYPLAPLLAPTSEEAARYDEGIKVAEEICLMVMNDAELHRDALDRLTSLKNEVKEKTAQREGITFGVGTVGSYYRSRAPSNEDASMFYRGMSGNDEEGSGAVKDPVDKRGKGRPKVKRPLAFNEPLAPTRKRKSVWKSQAVGNVNATPVKHVQRGYSRGRVPTPPSYNYGNNLGHAYQIMTFGSISMAANPFG